MTTAKTHSNAVDVSHLLTRMLIRDTGLETVQASVPESRSVTSRLIVAKITASAMNCVPIAYMKLSIGTSEMTFGGASPGWAGKLLIAHSVIRAFPAARANTAVETAAPVHGRLPTSHSLVSLRMRLPRPSSRPPRLAAVG